LWDLQHTDVLEIIRVCAIRIYYMYYTYSLFFCFSVCFLKVGNIWIWGGVCWRWSRWRVFRYCSFP